MNTHANKTQENKSKSMANDVSQNQSGDGSTFQFADNRTEAIQMRKLQEMADNSPQAMQLKAFQEMANDSPQAKQAAQLKAMADNYIAQQQQPIQKKENNTGLPDNFKTGIENLSGYSMDDVKVHYNSEKPAQLQAHAFAQGTDIHLGPSQEKHLPHEAWHVVQQKQGRVNPAKQMKGDVNINDDQSLEREADVMGAKAASMNVFRNQGLDNYGSRSAAPLQQKPVIQRLAGMEVELRIPFYGDGHGVPTDDASFIGPTAQALVPWARTSIVDFLYGGLQYGVSYGNVPGQFDISADHTAWRSSHDALRNHIEGTHIQKPGGPQPSMSNLEYRTEALEERDRAAEVTMRTIADAVRNHAVQSANQGAGGNSVHLGAPVAGQYTGIPVAPLRSMLQGDEPGMALFDTMNNSLDPSLYYQTTVGSLPSEIPGLFQEAADDIAPVAANNHKAELLRASVVRATAALNHGNNAALVNTFETGHKQSLLGWMTLVAQYLLAYQLETTSRRYRDDGAGHLFKIGGTSKNLVPYLSKTALTDTIAALPPAVRPSPTPGPNQAGWVELFRVLLYSCRPPAIDLAGNLGLVDYMGRNHHRRNRTVIGPVTHGEVFLDPATTPARWLSDLIQGLPGGDNHVGSGNELALDAGQEHLAPELSIRGEQAIPLEDRASQVKASFGDPHDIAHSNDRMNEAWAAAKNRRLGSTTLRTSYRARHAALGVHFANYGTLIPLVPALNALNLRYVALNANPDNLEPAVALINTLHLDFANWQIANSNSDLALSLLTPLINKANWSTKGYRLIGSNVVPAGVVELRTELAAGNDAATTVANLSAIGLRKLGGGNRAQVTTDMYQLVRDTPGWIGTGLGWTNVVNQYNVTNATV